jgi:UPF0271 protein
MLLNCDLGEHYGNWTMGCDSDVMPHIHQANIACGFHAGDPLTIRRTLALAAEHGVRIGAHPAYPDLVGFGRRSLHMTADELIAALHYQVSALDGMAACQGLNVEYIKPHGALYNDMMARPEVRGAIMLAVASYRRPLALMLQATPEAGAIIDEAQESGVVLLFEAFADRCYDDDGRLLSRSRPGAVHDRNRMLEQVQQLHTDGTVTTVGGHTLQLRADSLCVHGDNPEAVEVIRQIRAMVDGNRLQ